MEPSLIAFAVALPSAFALGVVFHQYALRDVQAVKEHVTSEADKLRSDMAMLLAKAGKKV